MCVAKKWCNICLPLNCHKSVKLYVCWMCLHCFLQQDTFMGLMSDEEFWMSLLEGPLFSIIFCKPLPSKTSCLHIHELFGKREWLIWTHLPIFDKKIACSCALMKWRPCLYRYSLFLLLLLPLLFLMRTFKVLNKFFTSLWCKYKK